MTNEAVMNNMANAIRQLRDRLFDLERRRHAPPGQWEDEAQERRRERANEERLAEWNAITERIVRGEPLDPCGYEQ